MIEVEVKTTDPVNVNVGDVYTETFYGAPSENQAVLDKFNEDENGNLYYGNERIAFVPAGGNEGQEVEIGNGLKLEDNVLSVDTTDNVEKDNSKPVTSAAVYTVVGNINAILESL